MPSCCCFRQETLFHIVSLHPLAYEWVLMTYSWSIPPPVWVSCGSCIPPPVWVACGLCLTLAYLASSTYSLFFQLAGGLLTGKHRYEDRDSGQIQHGRYAGADV